MPNFCVWVHLWTVECRVLFMGHCDLDLVYRVGIESGAYLLYSLR